MNFTMTVEGSLEVRKVLQELGNQAPQALRGALYDEAVGLLGEADKLVPRRDGILAGSKFQRDTSDGIEVGYGGAAAPYALAVHENPRSGKTGGIGPSGQKYKKWAAVGQWKYLETPFKSRVSGFASRIAASLRKRLLKES